MRLGAIFARPGAYPVKDSWINEPNSTSVFIFRPRRKGLSLNLSTFSSSAYLWVCSCAAIHLCHHMFKAV